MKILKLTLLLATILSSTVLLASPLNIKETIQKARALIANNKFSTAHKLYDKAIGQTPDNAVLMSAKADVYVLQKEFKKAIKLATKAHEIAPSYEWPLAILRSAYIQSNDFKKARATLKSLKKIVTKAKYLALAGGYFHSKGNYKAAEKYFRNARKLEQPSGLLEISAWNFKLWRKPNANQALLEQMIEKYPNKVLAHKALALSYKDRKKHTASLISLHDALELCNSIDSCDELKQPGVQKYLLSGELSGAYISNTPNAISGSLFYKSQYLSSENMLRIVQAGEKSPNNFEDLIKPQHISVYEGIVSVIHHKTGSIPQKWTLMQTQAAKEGQKFALNNQTQVKGELFLNTESGSLGDVLLIPFIEGQATDANAGSAADTQFNSQYSYKTAAIGTRALSSKDFNRTRHEAIVSGKRGETEGGESKFRIYKLGYTYKSAISPAKSQTKSDIPWWVTQELTNSKHYTSEYRAYRYSIMPAAIISHSNSSLFLSQELVFNKEYIGSRDPIETNIAHTSAVFSKTLGTYIPKLGLKYTRGLQFSSYDAFTWDLSLSYKWLDTHQRKLGQYDFKYLTPNSLILGVKNIEYLGIAKRFGADLLSIYCGIKLAM